MNHTFQDAVSLEMARRVVARLETSPELVDLAKENLSRWARQNAGTPSLLRCYAEWQELLQRPVEEVCERLCDESGEGQRLRQNSPFAGVLSAAEVWDIKRQLRHAALPA